MPAVPAPARRRGGRRHGVFADTAIVEPFREGLAEHGVRLIAPETVAAAALQLFTGDAAGECMYVQVGRDADVFRFRGIPGPR